MVGSGFDINVNPDALRKLAAWLDGTNATAYPRPPGWGNQPGNVKDLIGKVIHTFVTGGGDVGNGFAYDWLGGPSQLYDGFRQCAGAVLTNLTLLQQQTLPVIASKLRNTAAEYEQSDQQGEDLATREWTGAFYLSSVKSPYVFRPFTADGDLLAPAGHSDVFANAVDTWNTMANTLSFSLDIYEWVRLMSTSGDWADPGETAFEDYLHRQVDMTAITGVLGLTRDALGEIAGRMQSTNTDMLLWGGVTVFEFESGLPFILGPVWPAIPAWLIKDYADFCNDMRDTFCNIATNALPPY